MKILTAEQIRGADAYTIANEPIKSIDLMERAATKCYDWIYENAPRLFPGTINEEREWTFNVVVGPGNNGGDGLVIARLLNRTGYKVNITVVKFTDKPSPDFEANFNRLGKLKKEVVTLEDGDDLSDFPSSCVVIDAIFGTGLNRPAEGIAAKVIAKINESDAKVVSIDMPSGMFSEDNSENDAKGMVTADVVLSFQVPKLAFYLAESAPKIEKVVLLDIGLHPDYLDSVDARFHLLTDALLAPMRRKRSPFDHKGTFGHALLIAGSAGKRGAATMAVSGALRAGAGLVTLRTDGEGARLLHVTVPEAMVSIVDDGDFHISGISELKPYHAIGIGPGMGTTEVASGTLKSLIQNCTVPLVIDADGLNLLAENPTWLAFLPKPTLLTPHPGEFARLTGKKMSHYENIIAQMELSRKHGIYILLKGGRSTLSLPDGRVLVNGTGNPGMATGGMGDVLTGILTGLLAAGYSPMEAAALGMFIHGRAGDLALTDQSVESLLATDLLRYIGGAFESLSNEK